MALGHSDVDAMLDGISSRAWSEWQAYWNEYGFGEKRMDARFANLMAWIANLLSGKDSPTITAGDILPDENDEPDADWWDEYYEASADSGEVADEDQMILEATLREATGESD